MSFIRYWVQDSFRTKELINTYVLANWLLVRNTVFQNTIFFANLCKWFDAINMYEKNAAVYTSQPRFLRFPAFDPIFNGNPWCVCYNELFVCQIEVLPNCMKKFWTKCNLRSRVEKRTTTAVNCGFFTRKNGRFALPIMPLGKHKRVSQVCQPLCQIGTLQDGLVSGSAKTPCCWVTKNSVMKKVG